MCDEYLIIVVKWTGYRVYLILSVELPLGHQSSEEQLLHVRLLLLLLLLLLRLQRIRCHLSRLHAIAWLQSTTLLAEEPAGAAAAPPVVVDFQWTIVAS